MSPENRPLFEARLRAIHFTLAAGVLAVLTSAAASSPNGGALAVILGVACGTTLVGPFLTISRTKPELDE